VPKRTQRANFRRPSRTPIADDLTQLAVPLCPLWL